MSAKWVLTGKTRVCMVTRWFRTPLIGLQVEYVNDAYYDNGNRPKLWEASGVSALTEVKGLDPRKTSATVRYRAHKKGIIFRCLWLVMQVCEDPENNKWRDARVEDLGDIGGIKL